MTCSDNGREFIADSPQGWLRVQGVTPVFIAEHRHIPAFEHNDGPNRSLRH